MWMTGAWKGGYFVTIKHTLTTSYLSTLHYTLLASFRGHVMDNTCGLMSGLVHDVLMHLQSLVRFKPQYVGKNVCALCVCFVGCRQKPN